MIDLLCERCGQSFRAYPSQRKKRHVYCSEACYRSAATANSYVRYTCETCGKECVRRKVATRARRFCSRQCRTVTPTGRRAWHGYWYVRVPLAERLAHHRKDHTKRRTPRTWMAEHIRIAERALGRPLRRGEVVHHINCDSLDNHPSNLLVCRRDYHVWLHGEMSRRYAQEKFGRRVA